MIDIEKFRQSGEAWEMGYLGVGPDGQVGPLALRVAAAGNWSLHTADYAIWCQGPAATVDWAAGLLIAARDARRAGRVDAAVA